MKYKSYLILLSNHLLYIYYIDNTRNNNNYVLFPERYIIENDDRFTINIDTNVIS